MKRMPQPLPLLFRPILGGGRKVMVVATLVTHYPISSGTDIDGRAVPE